MSKQIQIRNDLYDRMVKSKKILEDRGDCKDISFSDVLDWLYSESEYL